MIYNLGWRATVVMKSSTRQAIYDHKKSQTFDFEYFQVFPRPRDSGEEWYDGDSTFWADFETIEDAEKWRAGMLILIEKWKSWSQTVDHVSL